MPIASAREIQWDLLVGGEPSVSGGSLVWQRTDMVGTEVTLFRSEPPLTATGTAVLAGPLPQVVTYRAEVGRDWAVQSLTVSAEGAGWQRTLRLDRGDQTAWLIEASQSGDLDAALSACGQSRVGQAGLADPAKLNGAGLLRLADSPMFVTWAIGQLGLKAAAGAVRVPTIRVEVPSLTVTVGMSTYQLVSDRRLRIAGEEPPAIYDLDDHGVVLYRPGRIRLAH